VVFVWHSVIPRGRYSLYSLRRSLARFLGFSQNAERLILQSNRVCVMVSARAWHPPCYIPTPSRTDPSHQPRIVQPTKVLHFLPLRETEGLRLLTMATPSCTTTSDVHSVLLARSGLVILPFFFLFFCNSISICIYTFLPIYYSCPVTLHSTAGHRTKRQYKHNQPKGDSPL